MKHYNFSPFPTLTTNRLILRQMRNEDTDEIFALRANEDVSKYIDRPIAKNVDEALEYILMINNGIEKNKWVLWGITLKETDLLIGTICLWNFSEELCKGEIGYELSPTFQGMGIMQEALTKVINYGFEDLKLSRIEGVVQKDNQKSIQLLEKNQFIRDTELKDIEKTNSIIFTLGNK